MILVLVIMSLLILHAVGEDKRKICKACRKTFKNQAFKLVEEYDMDGWKTVKGSLDLCPFCESTEIENV